jgi:hypothetical protein
MAFIQQHEQRYREALPVLRRYFELGGAAAQNDAEAKRLLDYLVGAQPGGHLVQEGLRRAPHTR